MCKLKHYTLCLSQLLIVGYSLRRVGASTGAGRYAGTVLSSNRFKTIHFQVYR